VVPNRLEHVALGAGTKPDGPIYTPKVQIHLLCILSGNNVDFALVNRESFKSLVKGRMREEDYFGFGIGNERSD